MSFDLGVWHSDKSLTNDEAQKIYLRLCEEWPYLEGDSTAVAAFYEELIGHWPEIDTISEGQVGDFDVCPWSCAIDRSGMAVVMCCVWSKANDVAEYVTSLAQLHELVLFDPQAGRVHLPKSLKPAKRGLLERLFKAK